MKNANPARLSQIAAPWIVAGLCVGAWMWIVMNVTLWALPAAACVVAMVGWALFRRA